MANAINCVVASIHPELLAESLPTQVQALGKNKLTLVTDTKNYGEVNALVKKTRPTALVVNEDEFRESVAQENHDFLTAFAGGYGGVRNIGLYASARLHADCVFLDDDSFPSPDLFEKYSSFFSSGAQLINGQVIGHSGGVVRSVLTLANSFDAFVNKKIAGDKFERILQASLSDASVSETSGGHGFNGANMGVCIDACKSYAFFPTPYRVEDGTYAFLAHHYGFNLRTPENPGDLSKFPVARHEKKHALGDLRQNLESEFKGSVCALAIDCVLRSKKTVVSEEEYHLAVNQAYKNTFLPYLLEKTRGVEKIQASLDAGLYRELTILLRFEPENHAPSLKQVQSAVSAFLETQRQWSKITEIFLNLG